MMYTEEMVSPCLRCGRVKDPENCENKQCKVWQRWFLSRWEAIRANVRQQMESQPLRPMGVPLGGRHYPAPHQLRAYRQTDPCKTCLCRENLCTSPCPERRAWEEETGGSV